MEKRKHILSMLLLVVSCLFCTNAFAYDALINGIYYNFNGDEAEVTYKNIPYNSNSYTGDVVIPESVVYNAKTYSVTSIGEDAFYECSGLTSITIPNSVTSIGKFAFEGCSGLKKVIVPDIAAWCGISFYNSYSNPLYYAHHLYSDETTEITNLIIPNSVTSIGYLAFRGCSGLTSVTIPNSVTSIGDGAFSGCSGLTSVTIPNSVTSIGESAFSGCSGLTSITIPNSVTSIGGGAFYGCSSLTSVTIPNSVTFIGEEAFRECYDLTSVNIGNSVTSIGYRAFYDCSALTSVTIPNSVISIGDYAFYNCNGLTSVTIPNSVISIGDYAFYSCNGLTSVTIPNSVTFIGEEAFRECYDLTSVNIGNSVTSIGDYAFRDCSSLTSVTIGNSVKSIGAMAFSGCSGLEKVIVPDIAAWCGIAFVGSDSNPLYYAKHLYSDETTEITNLFIPKSVTSIGDLAFSGCSGLTSVTIPNSVTSIGGNAFYNCSGLKKVIVPDIAAWCGISFYNSYSNPLCYAHHLYSDETTEITNLIIPNSVTSIEYYVFAGCSGLTSVTIPNSVTSIGWYAFRDCTGLTSVTIPNSVTSIGHSAFSGCKLRNVLIKCTTPPAGAKTAFSNQTLYHTTLYVPTDCWDAYAYDDNWYLFHNIRETATTEEQVAMQQAYTLMDANTFTYSVYDPVNNCIGTIKSVSAIDENNPNHSWQVITDGSKQYLYNLGAKKFATNGADGRLVLTAEPTPIDMKNGGNGIVLGSQAARQWALVGNDRLSVEQDIITGIDEIADTQQGESTSYDLQGRQIGKPQQGINIIRNANGTTKKVLIKH